jgi:hypothetical protein
MAPGYALRIEQGGGSELYRLAQPARLAEFVHSLQVILEMDGLAARIAGFPFAEWQESERGQALRNYALVRFAFDDPAFAAAFAERVRKRPETFAGLAADPLLALADGWPVLAGYGGLLGDRRDAHRLVDVAALHRAGARGRGVNVGIVDGGFSRRWLRAQKRRLGLSQAEAAAAQAHGWTRIRAGAAAGRRAVEHRPGSLDTPHGTMVARAVLAIAPEATLWDIPLIPDPRLPPHLSVASAMLQQVRQAVQLGMAFSPDPDGRILEFRPVPLVGPCILVNAWGVLNTTAALPGLPGYGDDPDHFLLNDVPELAQQGVDLVFAAGNCGEPLSDPRCGETDRGPGRSASGLNAHPQVLSVGAVAVDGMPIGLSAQGPGRLSRALPDDPRAREKPDLCAPSHFRDDEDAAACCTGSSAACGVAAGVLAALRSVPGAAAITPDRLRAILRTTARREADAWHPRLGWGVIDAGAALRAVLAEVAAPTG